MAEPSNLTEQQIEALQPVRRQFLERYHELLEQGVTIGNAVTATYAGMLSANRSLPNITMTTRKATQAGFIGNQ